MTQPPGSGARILVCAEHELSQKMVRTVRLTRARDGTPREALIVRDEGGVVRAYLNLCKHLPIPIDSGSREFFDGPKKHLLCATHGAHYRLEDGLCVRGPCIHAKLDAVELVREGGAIYVIDALDVPAATAPP